VALERTGVSAGKSVGVASLLAYPADPEPPQGEIPDILVFAWGFCDLAADHLLTGTGKVLHLRGPPLPMISTPFQRILRWSGFFVDIPGLAVP